MRILVVGAGATGGYFGGRLLEAGRDVTFLVRPARAARLLQDGLVIESSLGNVRLPAPPTVVAGELREPFDIVILSCKAYDLDAAIDDFGPAVGPRTLVIPLLNGMRHLDVLDQRLSAEHVLGGQCLISAKLDAVGHVIHWRDVHRLSFGERSGKRTARLQELTVVLGGAKFEVRASDTIVMDMWEKWVFLAALAGITCLMRASVGDLVAAGGSDLAATLLDECGSIASAQGWPPRPEFLKTALGTLTSAGSTLSASMLGDVERGARTEADHVLGDLLRRGEGKTAAVHSLLRLSYTSLKAYEARVAREKQA